MKAIIIFLLAVYICLLFFAYFFADKLIFFPRTSSYRDTNDIIKLTTADGAIISAIYLPNKKARYVILFSHGNAEDLGDIMPFLQELREQGYAVFAYDYHGYGTSQGKPTEQHAYADINAAYDYLVKTLHIAPQDVIVFGRSLGAAVSIDLAAREPVAGLIAESPFITAFRVLTYIPIFPFDKFNNLSKIKRIHCPVLVIHGTADTIVPFWHGKKLYQTANSPKQYLWIKGANHNDPFWQLDANYWRVIQQFVGVEWLLSIHYCAIIRSFYDHLEVRIMKKIITIICLSGLALCLAGCDNMTKQDVGVLTGGAIGGLVGSQIGSGSGQVVAAVAGAVVGGLIGGQIGKSMDQVDRMKMQRVLEKTPTNRTTSWRNPDSHAQYALTPTRTYYVQKQPCREYRMKAWIGGKQQTVYGKACRQPGGDWKIVK